MTDDPRPDATGPDARTGSADDPAPVTHLLVGLVAGAVDAAAWLLGPPPGDRDDDVAAEVVALPGGTARPASPTTPGDLAAGVLFGVRDVAATATGLAGQTLGAAGTIVRGVARLPGVELVTRRVEAAAEEVAARGRRELAESEATRDRVVGGAVERISTEVVPAATDRLAAGPLVDVLRGVLPVAMDELGRDPAALTGLVDQVLPGILDAALPEVLDRLAEDPELLLPLVGSVVDRVLPDILERLGDDPGQLMGVVDPVLPPVIARLGEDPEPLLALIDALLPQLLDQVLPAALDQLNEDPTVVRNLVLDQSGGMATEMANTVRARAVAADDIVDRIGRRLLRRPVPPRPQVATGPEAPAALGPGEDPSGTSTPAEEGAIPAPAPMADQAGDDR